MSTGPVEQKVKAATGGSALGVALAGLILWLLDDYAFKTSAVPDALVVAVWTVVPIGLTFVGGFLARHTPRHDPDAVAAERLADPGLPHGHVRRVSPYVGLHRRDPVEVADHEARRDDPLA